MVEREPSTRARPEGNSYRRRASASDKGSDSDSTESGCIRTRTYTSTRRAADKTSRRGLAGGFEANGNFL